MTTQVTNIAAPPALPAPDNPGATVARVTELLMRLQRAGDQPITFTPIAELRPVMDGTGDAFVFATVFLDCADGLGRRPVAIHELRIAADCLADDPPFPAAGLTARLRAAADQAASAALSLQRSA
ncbi:hypothetical protein [Brevundimonas sp.]|uniref:hypothetical protein n=1 Tax=Brevundimonas sp. TaxID=1871086 RepID=UPI00289D429D|nr:hypothetical protein [Brevundimonas sp.]